MLAVNIAVALSALPKAESLVTAAVSMAWALNDCANSVTAAVAVEPHRNAIVPGNRAIPIMTFRKLVLAILVVATVLAAMDC